MLNAVRGSCSELAVVWSGRLLHGEKLELEKIADNLIAGERPDRASDLWRKGIAAYGADRLTGYDEILLMDEYVMGPVGSMEELLTRMEECQADFWGVSVCHKNERTALWPHFLAVRGSSLAEWCLHYGNGSAPKRRNTGDLLEELGELGFRWTVSADFSDMGRLNEDPMVYTPVEMVRDKDCPFFSRDLFFCGFDELARYSLADQSRKMMEYLRSDTDYDIALIWDVLLRSGAMYDICRDHGLYRILPKSGHINRENSKLHCSAALILHLHYEDCFLDCFRYACAMPGNADVYITTTSAEKKKTLEELFSRGSWKHWEVRVIENRGRDVSALLTGCRDLFERYDVLCFAHDKKSHANEPKIVGESFAEHCFQNTLGSAGYVQNILTLFDNEPRLGMLCPPPPYHAGYAGLIGNEWTNNYPQTKELAQQLGITVPMSYAVPPVAPFGTIFWFRTDALRLLADCNWNYSDFPEEPNGVDGTLLHALERLYPYVVQQRGYYCAWVANEEFAESYTLNLAHMLRIARGAYENDSILHIMRYRIKRKLKSCLPEGLWTMLKNTYFALKKIRQ